MLTNFKNSRPQQFSFLFIVFLLLYFLVPENENSLLWRLPPLLKDIPLLINTLLDNLMFKWLTIPVYDPDWQMYEDKPIFRIITRSIADFLLFLIIFIREIFLGGLQTKGKFIDQVIRPTGLIDPNVEIRPAKNQTSIAYGNDYKKTRLGYDFILLHELGHEWWGNFFRISLRIHKFL